jgi:ABC-type Fe3+/spermidine/putrescine transport system ATPase subunit
VWLDDREITHLPPQKRGFGLVFQDYALFPHLNVERNIAYGLVEKGWSKGARRDRVDELLAQVGMSGYGRRRPFELSGGEQQRVALARALAPRPPLLLLDEPLSNLDLALREELKGQLRALLGGLDISAVYVTHDQSEAFTLADRIAVMRAGRIEQIEAAASLFDAPRTVWIARFLGHGNIYPREALGALAGALGSPFALLRADLVSLGTGAHRATLTSHERVGALHELSLRLFEPTISLRWRGFSRDLPGPLRVGSSVRLDIPSQAICGLEG